MTPPKGHESNGRKCSSCGGALQPLGTRHLRTAEVAGHAPGALSLEMFWCSACGKVEFYTR